jgi:ABC-type spermidine/putrescine transport system permease subunit II
MEGSPPTRLSRGFPFGFPPVGPALSVTVGLLALVVVTLAALSTSSYDDRYQLVSWPPSGSAWEEFARSGGVSSFGESLVTVSLALGFAGVPAATTGYFFARKTSRLRGTGVFLLVGAWILTPVIVLGCVRFTFGLGLGAWAPWLSVPVELLLPVVLGIGAIPPMALAVYSSLRDDFLGLPWPVSDGPRAQRFLREAVPRGLAGVLFGAFFAGTWAITDIGASSLYGRSGTLSEFMVAHFGFVGGAPVGAVAALVLFATVVSGFAILVVCVWLVRTHVGPALWRVVVRSVPGRDRLWSGISWAVTFGVAGATLYALFLPLAASVVFSFNGANSVFVFYGPATLDWYLGDQPRGLLLDPFYVPFLLDAIVFAAVAAAVGAPFGLLAAAVTPSLGVRQRFLLRCVLYLGAALPIAFFGPSASYLDYAFSTPAPDLLETIRTAGFQLVARLPLAVAVTFIVASSAGGWQEPRAFGVVRRSWVAPVVGAFLVAFAAVLGVFSLDAFAQSTWMFVLVGRSLLTPIVDAIATVLIVSVLVPLAAARVLLRGREAFRL